MSFYVTLPSNAGNNVFENSQSNFTVVFPKPIDLTRNYEVALVEFSYREFIEVDLGLIHVKFDNDTNFKPYKIFAYENEPKEHFINRFNYNILSYYSRLKYYKNNVDKNLNEHSDQSNLINEWFSKNKANNFDGIDEDIKITVPKIIKTNEGLKLQIPDKTTVKFEGYSQILFDAKDEMTITHSFILLSELLNFFDYMYVYCDAIEYQRVGDQYGQLLRTITKTSDFNKTIEKIFIYPHYIPVANSIINSLNFLITDPTGNQIKFASQNSKVLVKLHFRPKNE